MIEFLLSLLGEVLFQVVAEAVVEIFAYVFPRPTRALSNEPGTNTLFALVGASIVLGFVSVLVVPHALPWRLGGPPGISIMLAPIGAGALMHAYGAFVRSSGRRASQLATFSGGAVFAFGFAWTRFFLIQPS